MNIKEPGPRGWLPDATPCIRHNRYDSRSQGRIQPARCELHGVNLVHRFPPRCPLTNLNPLATLGHIQDAAWRVLSRSFDDPERPDALALLDDVQLCTDSVGQNMAHPTVIRLRLRKGVAA